MQEKDSFMYIFFEIVRWLADKHYKNVTTLAKRANIPQPTVRRFYKEEVEPKIGNVEKIFKLIKEDNIQLPDKYKNISFLYYDQKTQELKSSKPDEAYKALKEKYTSLMEEHLDYVKENHQLRGTLKALFRIIGDATPPDGVERRSHRSEIEKELKNIDIPSL